MSYSAVNVGTAANDNTGDALRNAFIKINANFVEQYGLNDRGVKAIAKATHGFIAGRVLTLDGTGSYVAITNNIVQAPVGIVSVVLDANNFILTQTGFIDTLTGLVAGSTYYVQNTGLLSVTISPLKYLLATSTTAGYILLNSKNPDLTLAQVLALGNDAGASKITNLLDPTNPQDAATRAFVLANTATPNLASVLVVGNSAGGLKITNLATPTAASDAATKAYVDGISIVNPNLATVLTVGNSAGSKNITNLLDPVNPQDAATKAYVLSVIPPVATTLANVLIAGNDAGAKLIQNLLDPVNPQDAATRAYVLTSVSSPFSDLGPLVKNSADPTKLVKFDASLVGTGTTVTITIPNLSGTIIVNPMTTLGDIIYGGASGVPTRLAAGTSTYVLTSNGPGVAPTWQAGATGINWALASGGTLTGANIIIGTSANIITYQFNSLAATQVNGAGAWYKNTTAAISGTQQNSPSISWEGSGFATTGSISMPVSYTSYIIPVQGAANPIATWNLLSSINGGSYGPILQVSGSGNSSIAGASKLYLISSLSPTGGNSISIRDRLNVNDAMSMIVDGGGTGEARWFVGSGSLFPTFYSNNAEAMRISTIGNFSIGSATINTAKLWVVQTALSSSWIPIHKSDPGAHTAMTASTEFISRDFNSAIQTWLAGTVATQRFNYFRGYIIAGASATNTATNAYTVYIDPPVAGANASITNQWGLGVNGDIHLPTLNSRIIIGGSNVGLSADSSNLFIGGIKGGGGWGIILSDSASVTQYGRFVSSSGGRFALGSINTGNANLYVLQGSLATTGINILRLDGGALTTLTASTEVADILFSLARTVQFSTGALGLQRAVVISNPTYSFVGASVITDAATMYISGAPVAGTNATITNPYALWIAAGKTYLQGGVRLTSSSTLGYVWTATDTAGNGSWQISAGGGITNSAVNTELMMSNGTNAVSSSLLVPSLGNLTLGASALAGATRTITAGGSAIDIGFQFSPKGAATSIFEGQIIAITNASYAPNIASKYTGGGTFSSPENEIGITASSTGVSIYHSSLAGTSRTFNLTAAGGWSGSTAGGNLNIASGAGYAVGTTNAGNLNLATGSPNSGGAEASLNIQTRTAGKLGFWNVTAIVRPATGGAASTFVANTSAIANDTATFDGYTIGQAVKALRNLGLLT